MSDLTSLIQLAAISYKSGDFQSATEHLSACLKLSTNGKEIDQLTPNDNLSMIAYLHLKYGQALLELARENGNVLGESVVSKQATSTSNYVNTADEEVMSESDESCDMDSSKDDSEGMDTGTVDLSICVDDKARNALQIANDICDDLQLAWEALDTSRILYQRISSERASIALIDVYESLSEVCIESENWNHAHENLKSALDILISNTSISGSKRFMAEIHFKMALVSEYSSDFDAAVTFLSDSKATLMKHLEESLDVDEKSELEDIISDIDSKVRGLEFYFSRLKS